jgi:hypothetical protein
LVEDPKELFFMTPSTSSDRHDDKNSTLPRNNGTAPLEHVPQQNKSATLSKLLRITKEDSSSPLKALREIGKPRLKMLPSVGSESVNSTTFLLDHDCENPCETPSYMANAEGNFPLNDPPETPSPKAEVKSIDRSENALPLPPRDRSTLQLNVTQKRHVRKHPLIIPAMATQRTLDKINQVTPVEDKSVVFPVTPQDTQQSPPKSYELDDDDDDVFEDLKKEMKISQEFEQNVNNNYGMIKPQNYTKAFIENNFPYDTRTYQNIEDFQKRFSSHDEADTASLHFESILEDESAAKISDDMVDGCFGLYEGDKSNQAPALPSTSSTSTLSSGNNAVPFKSSDKKFLSSSIESKKQEFSQKYPKYKMPRNELASNALFNKIKESVEMAAMADGECEVELDTEEKQCELKKSINHVSCEDLLDFSVIPKGPQRGSESDEVRIMIKHFGTKVG